MMTHSAENDRLSGTEGDLAIIAGDWRIVGVNTYANWVTVRHTSGATACLPWSAVASADRVFPPVVGKP
jgi:hypothetical protein